MGPIAINMTSQVEEEKDAPIIYSIPKTIEWKYKKK